MKTTHNEYRTAIVFSLKDRVGALCDALKSFKKNNINLTRIISRPDKKEWEYKFFVEFIGKETDLKFKRALKDMARYVLTLNVISSYKLRKI